MCTEFNQQSSVRAWGGADAQHATGIVDRMEGGAKNFAERQLPFRSLLSITDFGITPPT